MLKPPRNPNYAATVVRLSSFVDLENCSNVKAAIIFNNSVIVAKDTPADAVGLFFPVETALSHEFLSQNNLYRKPEWGNVDQDAKGFFEQHGRVKAMKFRGHKSEGFWIPLSSVQYAADIPGKACLVEGDTFDFLGDHEICRKYIPKGAARVQGNLGPKARIARLEDSIVENQFRLHYDTENLRRNADKIQPSDFISITDKWHGTSVVISRVLVKRELNLVERLLKRLGVAVQESVYGLTYSSRKVIKAVNGVRKASGQDFYTSDIWGTVAREVADRLPDGFTLYGEIVGYTEDGAPIQKGYHYGCKPGQHKFVIYRVTVTTPAGKVIELTWPQVEEFAKKYGFETVLPFYYGEARALFHAVRGDTPTEWQNKFVAELEHTWVDGRQCDFNNREVPAEGVVLRVDGLEEARAFKLKSFDFLARESKELDKGEVDVETAESVAEEVAA